MAWARFTADFDWPQGQPWHVAYKAGMRLNVTADCRKAALLAGAAVAIKAPSRAEAEALAADPYHVPANRVRG
jgi:hypothetical protein